MAPVTGRALCCPLSEGTAGGGASQLPDLPGHPAWHRLGPRILANAPGRKPAAPFLTQPENQLSCPTSLAPTASSPLPCCNYT